MQSLIRRIWMDNKFSNLFIVLTFTVLFAFMGCGGGSNDDKTTKWESQLKITASDAADSDCFGYSIAISGDYAIVGAVSENGSGTDRGAAYVFHRTGTDTWDAGTKITASDAADNDYFGYSVAISGDYAIVGAPYEDGSGTDRGAAYIFHRTGTNTWDTGIKIDAGMDVGDNDQFGWSVAISGDYAIVGAPYNEDTGSNKGAAYVFHRTGTNTWGSSVRIGVGNADNDQFGTSVAISGDYAVVGAPYEGTDRGATYIFHRTGTNIWSSSTNISASDAADGDCFGFSVAISGDYAIVGATVEDGSGSDRGAAYIFQRTGTNTWDTGTKIIASDAQDNDEFGYSVAISGDYAIVGALDEDGSGDSRGAAYIFQRTGTNTWDTGTKITSSNANDTDCFGGSVAISENYVIVGAPNVDGSGADRGAAYIFK
jgi:hypothetical protein